MVTLGVAGSRQDSFGGGVASGQDPSGRVKAFSRQGTSCILEDGDSWRPRHRLAGGRSEGSGRNLTGFYSLCAYARVCLCVSVCACAHVVMGSLPMGAVSCGGPSTFFVVVLGLTELATMLTLQEGSSVLYSSPPNTHTWQSSYDLLDILCGLLPGLEMHFSRSSMK